MNTLKLAVLSALSVLTLAACSDDDDDRPATSSSSEVASSSEASSSSEPAVAMATYQISLINASASQVLSPAAVFLSESEMPLWAVGSASSSELATLAEAGNPDPLIAKYADAYSMKIDGPTAPGMSTSIDFTVEASKAAMLSLASMPIFTNDAFTGVQNLRIDHLDVDGSMQVYGAIYDAGTEANEETEETVPGLGDAPAALSDGREASDQVTMHPGVVSKYGLGTSDLGEEYRFDSNSFIVKVTRTQ